MPNDDMTVENMLNDWVAEEEARLFSLRANVSRETNGAMVRMIERAIEAHIFRLGVLQKVREGKL